MGNATKLNASMYEGLIPTVAEAEATSFSAGAAFTRTSGYYAPGDGGGALYAPAANQSAPYVLHFQDSNDLYWDLKENEILYEMAGARGDNFTDDAISMQKAHDTGKVIRVGDQKQYVCSETVTIEQGGCVGAGKTNSVIRPNFNDTLYNVITTEPVLFRDFKVDSGAQRTIGAAIVVDPGQGLPANHGIENSHSVFEGLMILRTNIGIDFRSAAHWSLAKSTFGATTTACVKIQNLAGADSGDSSIMQCSMLGSYPSNVAILQQSSGGLKIVGNKILGIHNVGYRLLLSEGALTSILLLQGNSIENCVDSCIRLDTGASGLYNMVSVMGNELAGSPYGIAQTGTRLGNLRVEGNLIAVGFDASYAQGVSIAGAQVFSIRDNTFIRGGSNILCIGVGASAAHGEVGNNRYDPSISTGVNARVLNNSSSTSVTDPI